MTTSNLRVLVIDDSDHEWVSHLVRTLSSDAALDIRADVAHSSQEARQYCGIRPPDAIVMDLRLEDDAPNLQLIEWIAVNVRGAPIIVVSNDVGTCIPVRFAEYFAAVIPKHATFVKDDIMSKSSVESATQRVLESLRKYVQTRVRLPTCFISYSNKEEALARKLYDDLPPHGIACWLAPEDMKIGDKIRPAIDDAIDEHDKLLLVLSRSSIESQWVEQEVEKAFERERKENRLVLLPVRVDNAIFRVTRGWAATVKNVRNIGDFRKWEDADAYRFALERLLKDLKGWAAGV